ncbi:uncharacterized protein KGF55_000437 [Candida pseudojiufengensis]|uniref:uncharacterized protein n=1 Tax=Candida pseudojiufengensis TaxID=497109 RepID=UPI0022256A65|nr:uncharacterized protein KGF55_000437 [Candida pseudojiufengensis]KAI5967027.1 hypothetical protein KGF55_000437 [Candida pseudojiufengensis]
MPVAYQNIPSALTGGSKYKVDQKGGITLDDASKEKLNKQSIPYLPSWRKNEKYEPYEFIEYHDRALKADKDLTNLFPKDGKYELENLSPKFGTEIKGIQLSELNDAAKDELALLASQRGVLVFRDQDLIEKGPKAFTDFAKHYGELHIHPTSGAPKEFPEIHSVLTGNTDENPFSTKNSLISFHSDVSYELNPTGISLLSVTNNPKAGGDTVFADAREAYNRLSPLFREKLEDVYALHTAVPQANLAIVKGGVVKRHPVENIHPIIRTTPTGDKVLYVNSAFTKSIVGLKAEESEFLLKFLLDHISGGHDFQIRVNWKPNSVVVWDNRISSHSAILDFDTNEPRLIIRAAARAERPVNNLANLNKPDENNVYEGPEYLGNRVEPGSAKA